jgi:hypothetical protein
MLKPLKASLEMSQGQEGIRGDQRLDAALWIGVMTLVCEAIEFS